MRYKEEDGCYNIVITETVTLLSKYYDKEQFSDDTSCSASPVTACGHEYIYRPSHTGTMTLTFLEPSMKVKALRLWVPLQLNNFHV